MARFLFILNMSNTGANAAITGWRGVKSMFPQPYFRDKKSLSPKEIASIASLVNIQLPPYFQQIGLNPRQSGFHYLRDAVVEYLIATVEVGITKVIYPNVAEARSTTAGAVERAMRHTIDTAWDKGLLKDSGGGVFPVFHEKPANKNFIVALAVAVSRLTGLPFTPAPPARDPYTTI